jgi:2-oxoisovalerate dehydrogenase E2 component (dihydrolipoyl transacylase)
VGTVEFRMPDIGEGVAEAELVAWMVAVGDVVRVDDSIAEVMTDKATVELPSPVAGSVSSLEYAPGDRIAVGATLIRFQVEGSGDEQLTPEAETTSASISESPPALLALAPSLPDTPTPQQHTNARDQQVGTVGASDPTAQSPTRPLTSPAIRKRALDEGVDLRAVKGTGPAGRISHSDLDDFLQLVDVQASVGALSSDADPTITEIPIIGLRRMIAERMTVAKAHIPHITYVEEIDVTAIQEVRESLNHRFSGERPKLTILPFLVRALTLAIRDQPKFNSRFDDDAGVLRQYSRVDMGIAVQTPKGLMVPVLRDAGSRDLWDCAREISRLSDGAIAGSLERSEMSGSTLTITSLGALGGIVSTPIINYPEVAIIGVNKMQIRPLWDGTSFIPRSMMNLSSGFDHRVIDGWDAATFIGRVKELLEQPVTMFVGRAGLA